VELRGADRDDRARIVARDARAFGTSRPNDVGRALDAGRGVVASRGGTLVGYALGSDVPIIGYGPMIIGAVVAFGVIYARQPVQFFGVLPLSGREFMYGLLAVFMLAAVLQQHWEAGAAQAAAAVAAAVMTSKRWSPGLAWKRWRIARARRRLSVLEGGAKPAKPKDEQRYLN